MNTSPISPLRCLGRAPFALVIPRILPYSFPMLFGVCRLRGATGLTLDDSAILIVDAGSAKSAGRAIRRSGDAKIGAAKCVPMPAMRRDSMLRGRAASAQDILALGNGLKVSRVDARTIAAEVVELQPLRNRADVQLVANPMCRSSLTSLDPYRSVSMVSLRSGPFPTTIGRADDATPKGRDSIIAREGSRHA